MTETKNKKLKTENKEDLTEVKAPASGPAGTKRTLILIGGLALVTLILLILALAPSLKFPVMKNVAPTPTPYISPAHTTLNLTQPAASVSSWSSDITVSTNSNKIVAVQLELFYDPRAITKVDIKAGTFFKDPLILRKVIDPVKGRITYIFGVGEGQKPIMGKGDLATVSFVPTGKITTTSINFLPQTGISASGEIVSVLKSAGNIEFSTTSPTPAK